MTPEQWHRVKEVFEAALEREPGERSTFVGQACAGDELLCREVKSLLSSHEQESKFMEGPAAKLAAQSLVKEEAIALVGQHLGHYQIVREIGRGGMGVVYLAQDISLGRSVALKLLPTHLTGDPDRVRRFEREARSASALNHPNVCVIHAIIKTEDDLHFIAMEYVDGTTLRQRLTQGSMKLGEALGVAVQIAAALAAAHDAGVVHRDIKPENIMVRTDGLVKVLDFGLAKLAEPQTLGRLTQGSASTEPSTETGFAMGTPRYMSPEQARGVKVDARADIWSLGVVTYEMIAGRPPFAGDSAIEVMNAILKEEPPQLGEAKVAPALERIVRRCLEKKPEMRFQSASDLGFALEAMSAASGSRPEAATALPAAPESPRKSRLLNRERWIWLAASVLLALTALGLAWAYFARQPIADTRVMKFSILPPERTSFGHLAISPDGRWLAFTAATGGKDQLWVRALDSTEAKALDGTEGATYPFWSPESRSIGFFAGGKLKKIEVSGGLPATLCDVGVGTGGAWSRDGVILFSSLGGAGLSRVSATGGEVTSVIRPDWKRQETDFTDPCFLPDGRHFIYSKPTGRKEDRGVYFGSLNGVVNQRVLGDESNAVYAASSRGGGYLLFGREAALMAQPFDAAHGRLTGEPFTVAARVGAILSSAVPLLRLSVSVSENGVLVFDPLPDRQRNQMIWMDRGGRKVGTLDGMDNVSMLRFSPDDKRFIVSRSDLRTGGNDLWISDVSGGNVTRFTFDPANDIYPVWSPDGNRIVWSSNREGLYHLYEKAATGSGRDALLFKSDYFKFPTDWSRDGRFIIYRQIDPKTKYDVWVLPVGPLAGDQKPFPLLQTEANEAAAVLSPDGQWIAYTSDELGRYEVFVQSFPKGGSKRQVSTGGGIGPHWRGDGKELYYHAPDGKLMAVAITGGASFEAGAPVALFEFRAGGNLITPYYCVTRDGQRFLLSTIVENQAVAPLTVVVNWTADLMR